MVLKRSFSHLVHKMSKTTYFISRQLLILRVSCTFFDWNVWLVFRCKNEKNHKSSFNLIRLKPCRIGYPTLKNQWVSFNGRENSSSNICKSPGKRITSPNSTKIQNSFGRCPWSASQGNFFLFFVLWRILKKFKFYYEGKILRTEKCLRNEFYVIFWGFFSFWVKWWWIAIWGVKPRENESWFRKSEVRPLKSIAMVWLVRLCWIISHNLICPKKPDILNKSYLRNHFWHF